jgi:hypothetical protein
MKKLFIDFMSTMEYLQMDLPPLGVKSIIFRQALMRTSPRRLIMLWSNLEGVTNAIGHAEALARAPSEGFGVSSYA